MSCASQPIMAERCAFAVGDLIDNRWKVKARLGEGTFGQVFKVHDLNNGRVYALKLLKLWEIQATERASIMKRFDREYETGQIKSDYLVHSLDKGNVRGNAYIVMEYCQGGDLRNAVKESYLDLALIGKQILLGLKDLHLNGKVHRDLKPENVLLQDNSHAVLTDFGISGDRNNRLTSRGWLGVPKEIFGTIAYMPPEQMNPPRGNATVLPTTDIFSFGVMMYELITGRLPFGKLDSESDVPVYVNNGKNGVWDRALLNNAGFGNDWISVIEGCLEPDYKLRLQTIDDVMATLPKPKSTENDSESVHQNNAPFCKDTTQGVLLRVMQGEEFGKVYILNELLSDDNSSVICVGRATDDVWNNIRIKEEESTYISRKHCTIEKDRQRNLWIIRDGQFRTQCPLGLRQNHLFPCGYCTAYCTSHGSENVWKESLNGTFVNSQEVPVTGTVIRSGDIISIGDVKLRVEGVN